MALYATHVPLNPLQKAAVAFLSAAGALANPARADLVAAVGETTGASAFESIRDRMAMHPVGKQILAERPRINNETIAHTSDMPEGSFGRSYADFMGKRGFQADERPPVRFMDDAEIAYVATRYREVHDFWHVLFECPTTVSGELALKAVEFIQTGLPMPALAVLGAQYRLRPEAREKLWFQQLPWAVRAATMSEDLMCMYYEKHLEEPLISLRKKWRIIVAPRSVKSINVDLDKVHHV
ncbi:hypothetical protein BSKO_03191 [Bryopsis sp. KO-2023]|nr:hypothetical protein BSKO_03191 [Bryopsis sp. KO-2023]